MACYYDGSSRARYVGASRAGAQIHDALLKRLERYVMREPQHGHVTRCEGGARYEAVLERALQHTYITRCRGGFEKHVMRLCSSTRCNTLCGYATTWASAGPQR